MKLGYPRKLQQKKTHFIVGALFWMCKHVVGVKDHLSIFILLGMQEVNVSIRLECRLMLYSTLVSGHGLSIQVILKQRQLVSNSK